MPFSAIAIDDDKKDLDLVAQHFQSFGQLELLNTFSTVKDALNFLSQESFKVDIVFCDQEMPGYDGLTAYKLLEGYYRYFVLVTHYDKYALSAYQHNVYDYLLKPLQEKHTLRLLKKISLEHLGGDKDFVVYIKAENNEHRAVDMAGVPCILADGNYCHVYTLEKQKPRWVVTTTLKSMELQLAHMNLFIRAAKNSLVNRNHIRSINLETKQVRVHGINVPLKIGDTYLEALSDFYRSKRIFTKLSRKNGAKR
ncbi:LytR/AlgR family response regulator transcription factor [Olivibacter domesticus]|uniref:Two component transcriptional regulator, LytTR family n=1 Tax=Olivibacter domesticus TaxID=407022 RepID=A0A1H7KHM1_OLID1|nr:response regulator [Olivibacter domesticus]SEK86393.1 two component transcriptional regulator, LytTR family [Olivibacter domesticus]